MTWAIEQKGYSQRRACELVGVAPKTYRYRSRRPDDGELRRRLRELAAERRRFGYDTYRRIRLRPEHPSGLALQLATMSQAAPTAPKNDT